jgi:DNA polymerase (family X)
VQVEQHANAAIADALEEIAGLLAHTENNVHRARAFRDAANTIRQTELPVSAMARTGIATLTELPKVGRGIAGVVHELVQTGRIGMLERLKSSVSPESVLATVPGVGPTLARRVHDELGVDTLEELELAAHDGRLGEMHGVGPRRVAAVREALGGRLSRSSARRSRQMAVLVGGEERPPATTDPPVKLLLSVDKEYRRKAGAGQLRTIAPKRLNPAHEAWLAVLRTSCDGWEMTAMYSNTALAHQQAKTRDWVVIYYQRDGREGQCTIVTQHGGEIDGRRVVRGRELECTKLYRGDTRAPAGASDDGEQQDT